MQRQLLPSFLRRCHPRNMHAVHRPVAEMYRLPPLLRYVFAVGKCPCRTACRAQGASRKHDYKRTQEDTRVRSVIFFPYGAVLASRGSSSVTVEFWLFASAGDEMLIFALLEWWKRDERKRRFAWTPLPENSFELELPACSHDL